MGDQVSLVSFEEFQGYRQRRHNRASCGCQDERRIEGNVEVVAHFEPGDGPTSPHPTTAAATTDHQ